MPFDKENLTERDKVRFDQVVEITKALVDSTNIMGSDEVVAQAIAQGLAESHRTLQQNTMRSLKRAMVEYAKTRTDLRNEKAVELAKAIAELEIHLPLV